MSNKSIVQELVDGSAEIDRMRKEIALVLSMVTNYFDSNQTREFYDKGVRFKSSECEWYFRWEGVDHFGKTTIYCDLSPSNPRRTIDVVYVSNGVQIIRASHVRRTHDALKVLVEGMLDKYESFWEMVKPIIEAGADK